MSMAPVVPTPNSDKFYDTASDHHGSSAEYLIFRHERVGLLDMLGLLFTSRSLADYGFVECSPRVLAVDDDGGYNAGLMQLRPVMLVLVFVLQKILALVSAPLRWTGLVVEFLLNLLSLNGGVLGLIYRFITCSVTVPDRNKASYRSMIAQIDGRLDLYRDARRVKKLGSDDDDDLLLCCWGGGGSDDEYCSRELLDLTMMAAKIVYENEAYIKDAVNNHWKMHFVEFFDCWNKYQTKKSTQAFVFCDKEVDAKLICVAFRGTEPFAAQDWSTDVELSWISMGNKMGRVHLGFMKALGLQDEKDFAAGFPVEPPPLESPDKPLAYYVVRETLRSLLRAHPDAKVVVTGHSLGAALASLFPAVLLYHGATEVAERIDRVVTHAQPRVGDEAFASYMEFTSGLRYDRAVYRYDVVPRVPFDLPGPLPAAYRHFGTCIYYSGWSSAQVVAEVPNKNYFNPLYLVSMYGNAVGDMIRGLLVGLAKGRDFQEGWVSIAFRAFGLLVPGVASHSPRDYVNAARLSEFCLLRSSSTISKSEVDDDKV